MGPRTVVAPQGEWQPQFPLTFPSQLLVHYLSSSDGSRPLNTPRGRLSQRKQKIIWNSISPSAFVYFFPRILYKFEPCPHFLPQKPSYTCNSEGWSLSSVLLNITFCLNWYFIRRQRNKELFSLTTVAHYLTKCQASWQSGWSLHQSIIIKIRKGRKSKKKLKHHWGNKYDHFLTQ